MSAEGEGGGDAKGWEKAYRDLRERVEKARDVEPGSQRADLLGDLLYAHDEWRDGAGGG